MALIQGRESITIFGKRTGENIATKCGPVARIEIGLMVRGGGLTTL